MKIEDIKVGDIVYQKDVYLTFGEIDFYGAIVLIIEAQSIVVEWQPGTIKKPKPLAITGSFTRLLASEVMSKLNAELYIEDTQHQLLHNSIQLKIDTRNKVREIIKSIREVSDTLPLINVAKKDIIKLTNILVLINKSIKII